MLNFAPLHSVKLDYNYAPLHSVKLDYLDYAEVQTIALPLLLLGTCFRLLLLGTC